MLVTRFERLSRRISLAGLMSGHKAVEAIDAGRVQVDGSVVKGNFKVFAEAVVTVDGHEVPPPRSEPRIWAMWKHRRVLCQDGEREGVETLRSVLRKRYEKEVTMNGQAQCIGLEEETPWNKHFVIIGGLPFMGDGLVLLTNDGVFADSLMSVESKILSIYDVKVSGDPPIELLHSWRRHARAGGLDFGQVFCSITTRRGATTRLRVRLVESPERPLDCLMEKAKLSVIALRRHSFGPYCVTQIPWERCLEVPVHSSIKHLCPQADMRQVLVPTRGGIVSSEGLLRAVGLEASAVSPPKEDYGPGQPAALHRTELG